MESQELHSLEAFVVMMRATLEDAPMRLAGSATGQPTAAAEFRQLRVYSFRQTWPDASCGFGGIAAQVLTDAQTVVVFSEAGDASAVYVRGDFAYLVVHPNQTFWDAVTAQHLPGVAESRAHLGQIATP